MARIKIRDLPKDMKIRKDEMKKIMGGIAPSFGRVKVIPALYGSDDDGCEPEVEYFFSPSETGNC
ncbi:MAG: hypothetical protein JRG97_02885 [Deltaproteobacteria bacterium]|nr:hypothetical protein [Deltaproteobacteria bacterium]MBW2051172.1 hypothetical protein [Deltaproteobacteria bacterium]MBW2140002.1 hypothetical protein [Deltaproteobacteria bacterium]MBW2324770.1 hypothetical protein [Deltaproteobacteria bacterium]